MSWIRLQKTSAYLPILVLLVACAPSPVFAQVGAANIGGVVKDESGAVLPGVTVTVTNTATGRAQTLVTGDDGKYRAVQLVPGPYEITAELQGFGTLKRAIVLVVGSEATLDLGLSVASLNESVTVVGEAPLVEVAKAQPSSVITGEQLEMLPSLNRNFLVLAQLLPGTAPWRTGTFAVTKFGNVSDQRNSYTTIVDGGDIDDPIWGHPSINISQDSIAEFKVYRDQFDAQYGQAQTAVVTVVTKSGTNKVTGSAFYYGRDQKLNARNAFSVSKPPFKQKRVGFALGGPIALNKTHFFVGYERLMVDTAVITALPANNPFATMENGVYPNSTLDGNFDGRIDHRFNNANNMFVRYAYAHHIDDTGDRPVRTLDLGLRIGPNTGTNDNHAHSIVGEENWIISDRKVNTVRVHGVWNDLRAIPFFTGLSISRPSFTWGQSQIWPQWFPERRVSAFDTFFLTTAKHDIKMGGEFMWGDDGVDGHFAENGSFTFNTDAPFDASNQATWPFSFTQRGAVWTIYKEDYIAGFVQDTWTVHPRVRLNLGLRYDINTDSRNNAFYNGYLTDPKNAGIQAFAHPNRGTDANNYQPRTGIVWDVRGDGTLVARAGWGQYITRDKPWIQVSNQNTLQGGSVTITDPQLLRFYPDIKAVLGGHTLAELAAAGASAPGRTIPLIGDTFQMPRMTTTTVGAGWQLTGSTSLDIDYVHAYGDQQQGSTDRNLPASGAINAVTNPRPVPQFAFVRVIENYGKTWYDALETQVRQRVRGGNSLQVSYTLARALLDGVGTETGIRGTQRTPQEKGYNFSDNRHNLSISSTQALPWGFQVSTIARYISGVPISVSSGVDLDGDGSTNGDRPRGLPITVGRGNVAEQLRIINEYRATRNLAPFTIDRIKLNPFRSIDLRSTKTLQLGDRKLDIFLEAYNVLNWVNKTGGSGNISLASFFLPTGALDARQVQWGARYSF
jgi:hypothetical protein